MGTTSTKKAGKNVTKCK